MAQQLGFEEFIPAVEQSEADFRETQKVSSCSNCVLLC